MRFLEKLDLAILDGLFQKIADWWLNRTGKSNFWIARMLWWMLIVNIGMLIIIVGELSFKLLIPFVVVSIGGFFVLSNYELEEKLYDGLNARFLNWRRQFMPWGVIRLVMSCIMMTVEVLFLVSILLSTKKPLFPLQLLPYIGEILPLLFVSILYFSACTPKPRSPLKAGNRLATEALLSR